MKAKTGRAQDDLTRPLMVWSITDAVIENRELLQKQFHDIASSGFGGIAAYVRCSRYSWDDPMAVDAWHHINRLCHRMHIACWLGPDPRFVSHRLPDSASGLELLLFGNAAKADVVPNTATIEGGRYSIRCSLSPRHVHTLTDVAVEFFPARVERVYAFKRGKSVLGKREIVDITDDARIFYNARDKYVEAFGRVPDGIDDDWSVVAFFNVRTNHFDFSSPDHLRHYGKMLARLKAAGCSPDGVVWDEPGYTCQYGSIPYSPAIRKSYQVSRKSPLDGELWKLAFEAEDSSHIPVRLAYYRSIQNSILKAELNLRRQVRKLWGPDTVLGIHDTWHFESADMCDMNHGSMNLWESVFAKSGGFVDLGAVDKLKDPASPWYSNLAAMSVVAATLGKLHESARAYNNLWTVGDDGGRGWQKAVIEHSVKIMGLFGTRWLAHAYGPVGTVGQERTFLGTPELPGYPEHSTWTEFPRWNALLSEELRKVESALPVSNVLVLYPIESLYALADVRADAVAADVFSLVLSLLDNHVHVDLLATTTAQGGCWKAKKFSVGHLAYDFVLFPHPTVLERRLLRLLNEARDRFSFVFSPPVLDQDGKRIPRATSHLAADAAAVLNRLKTDPALLPVGAPPRTWVTLTHTRQGTIVSLAPARAGFRYSGEVRFADKSLILPDTDSLCRIWFPPDEEPNII